MEKAKRSFWDLALVCAGFPVTGAGLGLLLHRFWAWLDGLEWLPMHGLVRWVGGWPEPWALIGFTGGGLALGLALTASAFWGYTVIGVDGDELVVRRGDRTKRARRAEIGTVWADESGGLTSKDLVVLGRDGTELWRVRGDLPPRANIRDLLTTHGLPWRDGGDPHASAYRRWVEGLPEDDTPDGLPRGANALLSARQRALGRDDHEEADELRQELSRLGISLKDEKRRQHWRRTTG
ncbi:hypothetical protein J2S43_008340 [Catenuloplanes nepalensis]|uniref:Uncharacterized protein n=1 Tax=Catenuloplanes nepalensis TaxID=587533 RepID=A0ABT9N804_9ACTN|nr:hypothetical protein [Catenuloplanes nepalensis]MDP9799828.1 hypothetical protein [Catenuloplanes nepalensis]